MKRSKRVAKGLSYSGCRGDWIEIICRFFHQLFCNHKFLWYLNFESMLESLWVCGKCGKYKAMEGIAA